MVPSVRTPHVGRFGAESTRANVSGGGASLNPWRFPQQAMLAYLRMKQPPSQLAHKRPGVGRGVTVAVELSRTQRKPTRSARALGWPRNVERLDTRASGIQS